MCETVSTMRDATIARNSPELNSVGIGRLGEDINPFKITKALLENIHQSLASRAAKRENICVVAIRFTDCDTILPSDKSNTSQSAITFKKVSDVHLNSISFEVIIHGSDTPSLLIAHSCKESNINVFPSNILAKHYGRNVMLTHRKDVHACLGINTTPHRLNINIELLNISPHRVNINMELLNTFPHRVNINSRCLIMPISSCFAYFLRPKLILITFLHIRHALPQIWNSSSRKFINQTTMCKHVESMDSVKEETRFMEKTMNKIDFENFLKAKNLLRNAYAHIHKYSPKTNEVLICRVNKEADHA